MWPAAAVAASTDAEAQRHPSATGWHIQCLRKNGRYTYACLVVYLHPVFPDNQRTGIPYVVTGLAVIRCTLKGNSRNGNLSVKRLIIVNHDRQRPVGVPFFTCVGYTEVRKLPARCLNNIPKNALGPERPFDGAVFLNCHIVESARVRADMTADIRITGSQPAVRRQRKGRRVSAAGDARRCQIFEEYLVHKYLVTLHHEGGSFIAIRRIDKRDTVSGYQKLAQLSLFRVFHTQAQTSHIVLPVFGLLYLHAPHGIPFAVRVLPLFGKLIQSAGVVFRQLHLLQQFFPQVAFGDFPFEEIQVARRIIAGL